MSSFTRRNVLTGGALVGVAVSVSGAARGNIGEAVLQSCPDCSADLALGNLHAEDCQAAQIAPPTDDEIHVDPLKTAQATEDKKGRACGHLVARQKSEKKKGQKKQKLLSPD